MFNKQNTQVKMVELEPKIRITNFEEVACGYNLEDAVSEASRCLNCKHKPCVNGCPVNIEIPSFISKIIERRHRSRSKNYWTI